MTTYLLFSPFLSVLLTILSLVEVKALSGGSNFHVIVGFQCELLMIFHLIISVSWVRLALELVPWEPGTQGF